ncbi:MAG: cation:proton antiporter, partial [Elusimicrobia bacterium]|nr:cation:proton antiporter [Elusimicrobiota bacterium]
LADVFVPVFFVMVGARVRLSAYNPLVPGNYPMLGLAAGLIVIAIAGKLASGLAVWRKGVNRLGIGVGMVPRGEVGLIFAQIGLAAGVLNDPLYAAVVAMVVATTFVAPPLLRRSFN